MNPLEVVREVRRHLEKNGRVSFRMLRRQFDLDDAALRVVPLSAPRTRREGVRSRPWPYSRAFSCRTPP